MTETQQAEALYERRGEIAWLTLNRAQKANAMTISVMQAFLEKLQQALADDAVRAVVMTGAGTRVFSGGVDVRTPSELPPHELGPKRSQQFFDLLIGVLRCPKPVIAALNGIASGGGCMLALTADRIVAVESAAFALPEIDLGSPTYAGMEMLRHFAGTAVAADLSLTGRRMSAAEAQSRGLIAELVKAGELEERAQQAALQLAAKPAHAYELSKRWLNRPLLEALAAAHHESVSTRAAARAGEEPAV